MTGLRYRELADRLRERIALGDVGPGGALESEAELCRRYGLSRITVRRALEELRTDGIIRSRPGSGWSVAVTPVTEALAIMSTAADSAAADSKRRAHSRTIVEYEFTRPPPLVEETLQSGAALRVLGVNFVDDVPFDLVTTWMPEDVGRDLSKADFERVGGWVALREHGIELTRTTQSLTASVAGDEDRQHLRVRRGTPILVLWRVAYAPDDRPITASEHRYVGHLARVDVEFRGAHSANLAEPAGVHLAG